MTKIIKNTASVVLYAGDTLVLTAQHATNGDWMDVSTTTSNAVLVDGITDLPADWRGGHYTYIGTTWARTALGQAAYQAAQQSAVAQLKAAGAAAIQKLLDDVAQAHGYDSLERCITYVGDPVAQWNAEGTRAKLWRSACWSRAKQIQDDTIAGNWPTAGAGQVPTVADVIAAMPPAEWPPEA